MVSMPALASSRHATSTCSATLARDTRSSSAFSAELPDTKEGEDDGPTPPPPPPRPLDGPYLPDLPLCLLLLVLMSPPLPFAFWVVDMFLVILTTMERQHKPIRMLEKGK
jgi:hypothetical protein